MRVILAQSEPHYDEWCTDCKEYDHDKHCCPRFGRVIRTAVDDAQPRWIPVTERLPKEDSKVIITDEDGDIYIARYEYNPWTDDPIVEWWSNEYRVYPVAWMPMPEPYGEDGDT